MNKKFGNKYYTLITDEYIEKKSLFKTSIISYSNIKKIYMEVPMYDNFKRNLKKFVQTLDSAFQMWYYN